MDQYETLANAIVIQAANDYRRALLYLKKKHSKKSNKTIEALRVKSECERFFQGEWIKCLTDLDGLSLMKKIQKEI